MKHMIVALLFAAGVAFAIPFKTVATAATRANNNSPSAQNLSEDSAAARLTKLADSAKPYKDVNVEQFDKLRADKNTILLDVRSKAEFDAGHIPGAVNIDVNSSDFEQKVIKLDKSKTYLVHCAAGVRSVKACNKLATQDFKQLYNLEGGFKAWEKAGKKVEK